MDLLNIKEFFTAYAVNGKIYNCRENGLIWLHEMGHIERFKNQKLLYIYGQTMIMGTPFLYVTRNHPMLFYLIGLIWMSVLLYFETDAWVYAIKNYKKPINILSEIH